MPRRSYSSCFATFLLLAVAYCLCSGPVLAADSVEIVSPADSSEIFGDTASFSWSGNGTAVLRWSLWIGSSPGAGDIYQRLNNGTSATVTGLPADGSTLYVRLYYRTDDGWQLGDTRTYINSQKVTAELLSPINGSTLNGSIENFQWTANGANIDDWALWVGSTSGSRDIYNRVTSKTSVNVTGLPSDGSLLYVRLYSRTAGRWSLIDSYEFTAASTGTSELLTPESNTVLTSQSALFSWASNGAPVDKWSLWVGSSSGSRDIASKVTTDSSVIINGLPTDGSDIHVRLYSQYIGVWQLVEERVYTTEVQAPVIEPGVDLSLYNLTFGDEFDSNALDTNKWATAYFWGPFQPINAEEQYYVDIGNADANASWSPFELNNGVLTISAVKADGVHTAPEQPSEDSDFWVQNPEYKYNPDYDANNINYLSGVIASHKSYTFTHGYAESRIKMPSGKGLWSAFWLHTAKYVEDVPEIDIMEHLGEPANEVHQTMHYFDVKDNWRLVSTPTNTVSEMDYSLDFHTYAVSWEPKKVDFFIDGKLSHTVEDSNFIIAKQAMHVLTNLAVGGSWPGSPDVNTQFPAKMYIDYIRVYQKKPISPINSQVLADNYQIMFNEDFDGVSLDPQKWNTSYLWGPFFRINQEEQYYPDILGRDSGYAINPFNISDGTLKITASVVEPNELPALPPPDDPSWEAYPIHQNNLEFGQPDGWTPNYVSGLITSYDNFKFVHGYAEANIKIPEGSGLWPAFWLLNGYYVGQMPEIDIMEARGESTHEVHQSYHYHDAVGQLTSTTNAFSNPGLVSKFSDDFHRYGLEWRPGEINWYIDGEIVHTVSGPQVSLQLAYVIANLAVGGNYVSTVDEYALPATLEIDYIKVWQRK